MEACIDAPDDRQLVREPLGMAGLAHQAALDDTARQQLHPLRAADPHRRPRPRSLGRARQAAAPKLLLRLPVQQAAATRASKPPAADVEAAAGPRCGRSNAAPHETALGESTMNASGLFRPALGRLRRGRLRLRSASRTGPLDAAEELS